MRPSTAWRRRQTPLHRVLPTVLALLISGIPNAAVATALAAEVVSVEVVAGAPGGTVYIGAGASTSFPVQVSATGSLHPSISESSPARVAIATAYALSAAGAVSSSVPSAQMAFWRAAGSAGDATWSGAPTPYVVGASLQVAADCPTGTYTIPITPTITNGTAPANPLENLVIDSITVIVGDSTPPVTTASANGTLGNNGWYRSNVSVALSATDNPGGTGVAYTEYSLNVGATWTRGTSVAVSSEGVTTLYYRSADHAGNIETPAKQLSVKIDKTAPSLSFTNVHNGDCLRELEPAIAYNDTVSAIAAGTFAVTLNGNPYFGGVITEEGPHTLEASVSDQAGNTATRSVSFSIDRTNPTVVITNPADNGKYKTAQTFAFTVADSCPDVTVISNPALGHIWTAEGLYAATAS
ncbi:MAG: hypothetical protein Q8K89_00270, partial [Actinomycetota bacterium]|nr:hypothetical protein [Actinomycetota bacterium]